MKNSKSKSKSKNQRSKTKRKSRSNDRNIFNNRLPGNSNSSVEANLQATKNTEDESELKKKEEEEERKNIGECTERLASVNISPDKRKKLCNAIIGIDDSATDDDITQKWKQFTHIIFPDHSIMKEIYKTIKSNELCFFNEISFKIHPETLTDETLLEDYYIKKHVGKQTIFAEQFYPDLYYKTNIENCKHKYMAIPISYIEIGAKYGHANMLIIHKDENTIKVEHFEPHGDSFSSYDEEKNERINKYIDHLVYSLFVRNGYTKEDIEIIHPEDLCNLRKETHNQLQQLLSGTKFSGTCTIFSMWYSFYRLLYPSLSSDEVYRQMNDRLERSTNRTETIKMIIQTFLSLIKINIDDYTISGERKLVSNIQSEIKKIRGIVHPDSDENITKFIREADLATMKEMMENGSITNVDVRNKTNGLTALMHKTLNGNIDQMNWLLEKGANVDLQDSNGMSAIHRAIQKDDVDRVKLLLKYNPKLNIINKYGRTLLEYADGLSTRPKIILMLKKAMKS
jgi:hypothetical protein